MSSLARRKALSPAKGSDKRQRTAEEEGAVHDVQVASEALLKTALRFQTGARRLVPAERMSPVLQWSCFERRLQDEAKLRLALADVPPAKAQEKEEDLEQECVVLQQQLAALASQVNRDELIVHRIQSSQMLLKELFSQDQTPISEELKRLVSHRDKKATQLLGLHAQQTEVKNEIDELQRKIADLRRENRELYARLKEVVVAPQDPASGAVNSEVAANVESQRARNVILRNVMQLLVLESGVNWAKEPSLKAIFLD